MVKVWVTYIVFLSDSTMSRVHHLFARVLANVNGTWRSIILEINLILFCSPKVPPATEFQSLFSWILTPVLLSFLPNTCPPPPPRPTPSSRRYINPMHVKATSHIRSKHNWTQCFVRYSEIIPSVVKVNCCWVHSDFLAKCVGLKYLPGNVILFHNYNTKLQKANS